MRYDPLQRVYLVYSGGGGKQSSTSTQINYSPEEAARRTQVMDEAQRIYSQQGPGQAPVPASADTLAAQEMARSYATGPATQAAQLGAQSLQFGMSDVLNPQTNPYYQAHQAAAIRPVTEAYSGAGGVQSQIRSHFGEGPGVGTREAIAQGIAGRNYLTTVGDVTARMGSEAYGQGLDTFGKTLALAPQTQAMGMTPASTISAIGQQTEAYAENERQWELNAPWMNLNNYANVVFGGASPGSTTTSSGAGITSTQRAGMALSGAAMGMAAGAQYGAVGGPYGAAIGAGVGLLMSYM